MIHVNLIISEVHKELSNLRMKNSTEVQIEDGFIYSNELIIGATF